MDEIRLLRRLKRGDPAALDAVIDAYAAYVFAIEANILGPVLGSREDVEEAVSDVFLSLWNSRDRVEPGKLKAYLGAIARNTGKNRLRGLRITHPLDDDVLAVADMPGLEAKALQQELRRLTREAVESLPEPDREIFQRYYYLYERTADIAREMAMNQSTVTTKLARGRERLRAYLEERGYTNADSDH